MTGTQNASCADRPGEQGFILVTVIGVLLILAIVAASLMLASRTEIKARAVLGGQAELAALADGIVRLAALRVVVRQTSVETAARLPVDGTPMRCVDGATVVTIRVNDTNGLIDLNNASGDVLEMLLIGSGKVLPDAVRLAAAILDFRDADDVPGPNGAESQAYQQAGRPYGPKNAVFESIDELDQVLGMTPDLLEQLRPLVTVHSRSTAIDPGVAPVELLQVLMRGMAARSGLVESEVPLTREQFRAPPQLLTRSSPRTQSRAASRTYVIGATASRGEWHFSRQAVIEISQRSETGFVVRSWSAHADATRAKRPGGVGLPRCDDSNW